MGSDAKQESAAGIKRLSSQVRKIRLPSGIFSYIIMSIVLQKTPSPLPSSFGSGRIKMNIHAKMNEYNEYLFDISGNYTG